MDVRHLVSALASIAALLIVQTTQAAQDASVDLAKLQKVLQERLPTSKIVDIRPAPVPGIYEIFTGGSLFYSDATGNYVFDGALIDSRTQKDLTDDRLNERNAIAFDSLPFDKAIKVVKGNGSRRLAVFTDPDCPYCKRLEEEMKTVNNVTVYVFVFPLKQLHPNAERHAKSIWCSGDSAKAWTAWLLENKEPKDKTCNNDPVEANLELGKKLNISGTPTLYFENGARRVGALKAADLEAKMNEAKKG